MQKLGQVLFVVLIPIVIGGLGIVFQWWDLQDPTEKAQLAQLEKQTALMQELLDIQTQLVDLGQANVDFNRRIAEMESRIAKLENGGDKIALERELASLQQKEVANRVLREALERRLTEIEAALREMGVTPPGGGRVAQAPSSTPIPAKPTSRIDTEDIPTPREERDPTRVPQPSQPPPTSVPPTPVPPTPVPPTPVPPTSPPPTATRIPTKVSTAYPGPGPVGVTVVAPTDTPRPLLPGTRITEDNADSIELWRTLPSWGFVESVDFVGSSSRLAWSGAHGFWVYDLATDRELQHSSPFAQQVHSVLHLPGAGLLAAGVDSDGPKLQAWTEGGSSLWQIVVGYAPWGANAVASPSGRHVASTAAGDLRVWRVDEGQPHEVAHIIGWSRAVFLGDERIASWLDGPQIHDLSGRLLFASPSASSSGYAPTLAVSPDGSLIAAGNAAGEVPLWRSADLTLMRTLYGHSDFIQAAAFSPDGRLLATGSQDRTVRIWRVSDGAPLSRLQGFGDRIGGLAFSPDGNILATGSLDGNVRLWAVDPPR